MRRRMIVAFTIVATLFGVAPAPALDRTSAQPLPHP